VSSRVYVVAKFRPKEGKFSELYERLRALEPCSLREDGCIQYRVTHQIESDFATGDRSFPLLFNEIWSTQESFERHCQRQEIVDFFEQECLNSGGLVADYDVSLYGDEIE